jgi:hypothetical protein
VIEEDREAMTKYYYKDGTTSSEHNTSKQLHRIDGPAVEYADGSKSWYVDDLLHRVDGPAIEWSNGSKSWWVDDELYSTEKDFNKLMKAIRQLPLALRLIDPREWVRNYGK